MFWDVALHLLSGRQISRPWPAPDEEGRGPIYYRVFANQLQYRHPFTRPNYSQQWSPAGQSIIQIQKYKWKLVPIDKELP